MQKWGFFIWFSNTYKKLIFFEFSLSTFDEFENKDNYV